MMTLCWLLSNSHNIHCAKSETYSWKCESSNTETSGKCIPSERWDRTSSEFYWKWNRNYFDHYAIEVVKKWISNLEEGRAANICTNWNKDELWCKKQGKKCMRKSGITSKDIICIDQDGQKVEETYCSSLIKPKCENSKEEREEDNMLSVIRIALERGPSEKKVLCQWRSSSKFATTVSPIYSIVFWVWDYVDSWSRGVHGYAYTNRDGNDFCEHYIGFVQNQQLYFKVLNGNKIYLQFYKNKKLTIPADAWWYRILPDPKNRSYPYIQSKFIKSGIQGIYIDKFQKIKYWVGKKNEFTVHDLVRV